VTEAQKQLKAKHGTQAEFAAAVYRCTDITVAEAHAAVEKYDREWAAAGEKHPAMSEVLREFSGLVNRIDNGSKLSIGSINNVREVRFNLDEIARWRELISRANTSEVMEGDAD
jgi:uncharacterized protein with WD repeat